MLELVVGMALAVGLALAIAPLVLASQRAAVRDADRVLTVMQGRVAAARFERDFSTATAADCRFHVSGPVLEATPSQVVILGPGDGETGCRIIEWEIDGNRLMRRWGPCPDTRPSEYSNSLYVDHKTMMEGLADDARISYRVDGTVIVGVVPDSRLTYVEGVMMMGSGVDSYGEWQTGVWVATGVGW